MKMIIIRSKEEMKDEIAKTNIIEFLYNHLDQFGDEKSAIEKSIDYAYSNEAGKGGYIVIALEDNAIVGCVLMNKTGMSEFIPEYYLVYVAVHKNQRGKGLGGKIIQEAIDLADGDVALHVEYDNPAKRLYERLGFQSKYAEMRYKK